MGSGVVRTCHVMLDVEGNSHRFSPSKLRGYMGHLFTGEPEFHHHMENAYHYPLIQYKMLGERYLVMGFGSYADMVYEKVKDIDYIVTDKDKTPVKTVEISLKEEKVRNVTAQHYEFLSPWLALNNENYAKYKQAENRKDFLENIMIGNIISAHKGLGIQIDFPLMVDMDRFTETSVTVHENQFLGFWCKFRANITLLEYMGIGKSVSKGFGTVSHKKVEA